jgi:uncharacterized protein
MKEKFVTRRSDIARFGLFAARDIKKGEFIIEYKGDKILNKEMENTDKYADFRYIIELNDKWCLDGNIKNNPAKYINHSCLPNSYYQGTGRRVLIYATKNIKEGEEITVNYGKVYFNSFLKDVCGCPKCSKKRRKK